MSYSSVKTFLSYIAEKISDSDIAIVNAKNKLQNAYDALDAISTTYADEISEISGYTPTGAFETLAQDEAAKLTPEYQALKTAIGDLLAEFPS